MATTEQVGPSTSMRYPSFVRTCIDHDSLAETRLTKKKRDQNLPTVKAVVTVRTNTRRVIVRANRIRFPVTAT